MRIPVTSAFVALSLAIGAQSVSAAVIYVAKYSPGPVHDGKSWLTAYTAIVPAYTAAAAGDEVWVGPGTYAESIALKPNVSLYGGFIGIELFRDQRVGLPGLTSLGLSVDGSTPIVRAIGSTITSATVLDGFTFSDLKGGKVSGIAVSCTSSSPTISHNVFSGIVSSYGSVISLSSGAPVVVNNIITACSGGIERVNATITLSGMTGAIINNTIVGNAGYAVSGSGSPLIANNIVAHNYGGFQMTPLGGSYPTYRNNCVYGNLLSDAQYSSPSIGKDGNIASDPRFAVFAYGNLHIAPDSPCRDAGSDSAVSSGDTDVDLQPRILGAHVDIGADESDGRTWSFSPRIVRVSPDGNDANDGSTWALAKKSLQAGIDLAASNGGEVWVKAGSYTVQGNPSNPLLLRPYCYLYGGFAGTETALNQRDWTANPSILNALKSSLITVVGGYQVSAVDGFVLTGGSSTNQSGAGITCTGASPYIRNNVFIRNTGPAVHCAPGSPIISNNAFSGNTVTSPPYVVGTTYGFLTIDGNIFAANGPVTNISPSGSVYAAKSASCSVTNNLFIDNHVGVSTSTMATSGVQASGFVANNTFVNNRGVAVNMVSGTAANNIIAFNDKGIFALSAVKIITNDLYGNGTDYPGVSSAGKNGNIGVFPMFNSLLQPDYRLMDNSPCIDAGDAAYVVPGELDLDGYLRFQGRSVDMGCFESSAASMLAHWTDVIRALKIAGGLQAGTPEDMAVIAPAKVSPGLELIDAETLLRSLAK